jgi:polyhydroxybutyrate depolymerase
MEGKILLKPLLFLGFFLACLMTNAQRFISKTIQHNGLTRAYSIYVPASYDGTTNFPLLFNLHGGGGTNSDWQAASDLRPIADTADFILVYPQARPDPSDGNSFNWIPKVPGSFDDVPFFSSLIDTIASNYQIDQNRIYACGYSLGGDMTFELGCKLNNRIAAIAPVARTMQANPNSFCSPVHPTGVLTILGTDDFVSTYNGIVYGGIEYYISAAATHRYWATHNNCDTTATVNNVSPSVERYTWSTASGCAYVEELKVIGGGHDWPGSFGNMTIDANIEIWQFVSRYDINGLIECSTSSIIKKNNIAGNFSVYPNPVKDIIHINVESEFIGTYYAITSVSGQIVSEGKIDKQDSVINIQDLSEGIYFMQLDENTHQSFKIIKQ